MLKLWFVFMLPCISDPNNFTEDYCFELYMFHDFFPSWGVYPPNTPLNTNKLKSNDRGHAPKLSRMTINSEQTHAQKHLERAAYEMRMYTAACRAAWQSAGQWVKVQGRAILYRLHTSLSHRNEAVCCTPTKSGDILRTKRCSRVQPVHRLHK